MGGKNLAELPSMIFADDEGRIYDHPYFRMAGFAGKSAFELEDKDLVIMPEFSRLFYLPKCPPVGVDPQTGDYTIVEETEVDGVLQPCHTVAAFLEPGFVRSHLPATKYSEKDYILPSWAYTAVGFREGRYWTAGFRIEYNRKWDPRNYDDRELIGAIDAYKKENVCGSLLGHLENCATRNHCFAAKNLFMKRWEAPIPVSINCNASCLGCLSLQPDNTFEASHERIAFRPSRQEIVSLAVDHLDVASEPIVSFGQGCEGEPLTEYRLIRDCIKEIRERTGKGTINLNTNGSVPKALLELSDCGLDSVRISLNSARPEYYNSYFRPKGYGLEDVKASISLAVEMGLYTMLNYLVFPGVTDQEEEIKALINLVESTGINFIHMKNLCIDPVLYLENLPDSGSPPIGIRRLIQTLHDEFPGVQLGYFNQPVR